MKIALVAGDDLTRNHRVRWEAEALAAAGHRVTVYGVLSAATEEEEDKAGVVYVRVPVRGRPGLLGAIRSPLRLARWYERMQRVVDVATKRETPEAIHACDLDVAGPALAAARALQAPLILETTGAAYVERLASLIPPDARGAIRRAYAAAVAHLRRRGDALETRLRRGGVAASIVDTASLGEDLQQRYGGAPAAVVRSFPPLPPRRPSADADGDLRRRLGIFPTERVVLFLGPAEDGCGLDAAIRAVRTIEGCVLVALGVAPRLSRWEEIADDEGVTARVRFVAPLPEAETARLAASAEVALVPTEPSTAANRLGVPARLFHALHCGLPVVASDTREVGALVREARAGVLYPAQSPQDPAVLAEAIRTLLSDGPLTATCAEAARIAVLEELNWEKESLKLIDLYDEVEQRR